jgi:uncharacterized protein YbjT (DUF2867 family)
VAIPPPSERVEAAELSVVTGAFGYTGKYITRRLVSLGKRVRTLTRRPSRENPFGDEIEVAAVDFHDASGLTEILRGASTLYNTYWIRFPRGRDTFERAVANTEVLLASAREAGIARIVHISVTNASPESPFAYFAAKAEAEELVRSSGLSHAIIRPTLIFGEGDILVNNIAWFLRRFPVFPVFGSGDCRLQPVYAEDLAEVAVDLGSGTDDLTLDAAGPDVFTFEEFVRLVADAVRSRAKIVHMSPTAVLALGKAMGWLTRDVVVTREEIAGLMSDLLVSGSPPRWRTRFGDWLIKNAASLGTRYASELRRHYM